MIRKLFAYSAGNRNRVLLSFAAGGLRIAATLWFITLCKQLIDIATHAQEGDFKTTALLMVLAIVSDSLLGRWTERSERLASLRIQNKMRHQLFNHVIKTEWQGKEKHHSGDMMNRLERDVQTIADFIAAELPFASVALIQFIASFLYLFNLDQRIALILVGIVPVFMLLSRLYYRTMKRLTHQVRQSESQVQAFIQESIQNKLVFKTHHALHSIASSLASLQKNLLRHTETHTRVSLFTRTITNLGFSLGYITVFVYGAYQLSIGLISYGVMIAFLQLISQIQRPILQLTGLVSRYITASTAIERISEMERIPEEEQGDEQLFDGSCGIRIHDVSFHYAPNTRTVIQNLSYHFPPNSQTAVIGETGAGKTTLLRLLLSLVKPTQGTIELYTKNEQETLSSLTRSNFIYVPQGNSILSGTIRYNLLLGDPNATDRQIETVIYTACAEFVYQLPQGLDTLCGEKGGTLSEGQAQRIAIARALLGKGNILLFDESTSALDAQTESTLMERLKENYTHKTMIFITHRPCIIDHCDQTLKIDRII